jgi:predicted RNA-binding protein associated with RNAse of E/G family
MADENGNPRDYYANVLNYVTPVEVDKTPSPNY